MSELTEDELKRGALATQKDWAADVSALVTSSNNLIAVAPQMMQHAEPETLFRLQDDLSEMLDVVTEEIHKREDSDDEFIADNDIVEELDELTQGLRAVARARFNSYFESLPVLPEKKNERTGMYL